MNCAALPLKSPQGPCRSSYSPNKRHMDYVQEPNSILTPMASTSSQPLTRCKDTTHQVQGHHSPGATTPLTRCNEHRLELPQLVRLQAEKGVDTHIEIWHLWCVHHGMDRHGHTNTSSVKGRECLLPVWAKAVTEQSRKARCRRSMLPCLAGLWPWLRRAAYHSCQSHPHCLPGEAAREDGGSRSVHDLHMRSAYDLRTTCARCRCRGCARGTPGQGLPACSHAPASTPQRPARTASTTAARVVQQHTGRCEGGSNSGSEKPPWCWAW